VDFYQTITTNIKENTLQYANRFALTIALLFFTNFSFAAPIITSIENDSSPFDFLNNGTIGYEFQVDSKRSIVSLGMWDFNNDGFTSKVNVGLWDKSGILLGSVLLGEGTSGSLQNGFRYLQLSTPVQLIADTSYILGAFRTPGVHYLAGDRVVGDDFTVSNGVTIVQELASSRLGGESAMTLPTYAFNQSQALIGPNALFSVVEANAPATLAIMLIVFAGLRLRKNA